MDRSSTGVANFPSLDGKGYNTSFVTGFQIFDNGDPDKVQAAKDFLRYFMSNEEFMNYAQVGIPASNATAERVSEHIFMQELILLMQLIRWISLQTTQTGGVCAMYFIHISTSFLAEPKRLRRQPRHLMRIVMRRLRQDGKTVNCMNK